MALVIITAAMEDIRRRSTKKDKGHSMRREEGWMVGLNIQEEGRLLIMSHVKLKVNVELLLVLM